jgi:hypothetical protein
MLCDFVFDADGDRLRATCARCGRVVRVKSRRVFAACRAAEVPLTAEQLAAVVKSGAEPDGWRPWPIGDAVQRGLAAVGITEERIQRMIGGRDCGCGARAAALNAYGERLQRRIRGAAKAVAGFYIGE